MEILAAPRCRITTSRVPSGPNTSGGSGISPAVGLTPSRCRLGRTLRPDADVAAVPAHAAGRPGRRRGRQPPAPRPGRLHPPGRERDLLLAAARLPGAAQGRADRARGDGRRRRPGAVLPIVQPLELWERSGRDATYGPAHVPSRGPQGDRVLPVADGRGGHHDDRRGRVLELPRPAGEPLPDQLEVPRRAAAPLRAAARPRVPDEGRVLLRRRRRRPAAQLPADVRRVHARLHPLRAHVPAGGRRRRARSAAT